MSSLDLRVSKEKGLGKGDYDIGVEDRVNYDMGREWKC